MAVPVFLLARETGWTEEQILNLPSERINTYYGILEEIYKKP